MAPRRKPLSLSRSLSLPGRGLGGRVVALALIFTAGWLLALGYFKPQIFVPVRVKVVDGLVPVLDSLSRPAELLEAARTSWTEWTDLRGEVARLRQENARLRSWEQAGSALVAENENLKSLLKFHAEPQATSLTARVIATTGAPYAASMIVTAGAREGVRKNMAAVNEDGLVGRVIEVGEWSARILLLHDPESRVPIVVQEDGTRAILAGLGNGGLELRYLPSDAVLRPGMRLLTSGHGGLLPPNLPVATIAADGDGALNVVPAADSRRLNFVRLLDFDLAGGAANQFGGALRQP